MPISKKKIKPKGRDDAPILVVMEAPTEDDDYYGLPLKGKVGDFFTYCMESAGLLLSDIRVTYVCPYHPVKYKLDDLHGSPQLAEGKSELLSYLSTRDPKLILAVGDLALETLMGFDGVWNWRGSVLEYNNSLLIPIIPPGFAFSDRQVPPILNFDLRRCKKVFDNGYEKPYHNFDEDLQPSDLPLIINEIKSAPFIAADIETIRETTHILCFGFATSPSRAFCIRNRYPLGQGCDPEFARAVQLILDAAYQTTYHNGLFDTEVLKINGIYDPKYGSDTMYAQRVIEPELPVGLDFLTSIYTDEPYYKEDGKESSPNYRQTLWNYNCKDCICTWQSRTKQDAIFISDPVLRRTYEHQLRCIPLAQDLQSNGVMIDQERNDAILNVVHTQAEEAKEQLWMIAEEPLNIRSPIQMQKFLYGKLKLPVKTNKNGKVTTDEDAVVKLLQFVQKEFESRKTKEAKMEWMFKLAALKLLLQYRGLDKLEANYLTVKPFRDGLVHSSWGIAGTDTGRWASYAYVDGSGWNAQTIPRPGESDVEIIVR